MIEHKNEQEKIDKTIDIVKYENKEFLDKYKQDLQKVFNNWNDYTVYKNILEEQSKKVNKVNAIIDSPFIGKIKYLTINGKIDTAYIGYNAYYSDDKTIIHDYRSEVGAIFRMKNVTIGRYNIIQNRILNIKESILESYIDVINRNKKNNDYMEDKLYSDLIEVNKRDKEILSTIDYLQNNILELPFEENVIINGVPGSGKTILGGYRLSIIAYKLSSMLNSSRYKMLYLTNSDLLKRHTIKYFTKIDLESILFKTTSDSYNFTKISKTSDPRTLQVIDIRNGIKGRLIHREEYDNHSKECMVKFYNEIEKIDSKYLMPFRNEFTDFAKLIFGQNTASKLILFENYFPTQIVHNILMDDDFLDFYTVNIFKNEIKKQKLVLIEIINKNYGVSLKNDDINYLYYIAKIYYNAKNRKHLIGLDRETFTNIRHIFLDEAQDYTISEFKLLKMLYFNAYFTLCGDVNQSNGKRITVDSWEAYEKYLYTETIKLNTCYRSSRKIVKLMNKKMSTLAYGKAINYKNAKSGSYHLIKKLSNNYTYFTNFDIDNTCLIYFTDEDKYILESHEFLSKYNLYLSVDVKGLEFENAIIFYNNNNYKLSKKEAYMVISRALTNLVIIENL